MPECIQGDLVTGEDLERTARQRSRAYHEKTIARGDVESYLKAGWEQRRAYKTSARMRKAKEHDELLEDELWLLFKNMGFQELNRDRAFKVVAGATSKQIDVFARDANRVLVGGCEASRVGAGAPQTAGTASRLAHEAPLC